MTDESKIKQVANKYLKIAGKFVYDRAKEAPAYISKLSKNVSHNLSDTPSVSQVRVTEKAKYVDVFDKMLANEKKGGLF
jgi:ribosome-binding factor A